MTAPDRPETCVQCDRPVEECAFCDEPGCGECLCSACLRRALGVSLAEPHGHGG